MGKIPLKVTGRNPKVRELCPAPEVLWCLVKPARDSLLVKDNPDVMVCVVQCFPWHLVLRTRYATHFPSYALPPAWPDVLRK